ncbi:MAG: ferredoxin [Desulfobacterales bacterium]|nr:ferredoxin [Desulfobacterales bacterium]
MMIPTVDMADCVLCEMCIQLCPTVFRLNSVGYIEVIELESYPSEDVNEVIKHCPKKCITWTTG